MFEKSLITVIESRMSMELLIPLTDVGDGNHSITPILALSTSMP